MPGQCYSCASSFGVFKKEFEIAVAQYLNCRPATTPGDNSSLVDYYKIWINDDCQCTHGCKNCGFSFCKDCLREKIAVPRHNNQVHRVCVQCFKLLTGKCKPESGKMSPPRALRQMAGLESGSSLQGAAPVHPVQKGMNVDDAAMAERLARLKADRLKNAKPIPSCQEMERRIALLKTENKPPPPTETEMAAKLARLKGEGKAVPTDAEMATKLAKLKGQNPESASAKPRNLSRGTQQEEIDDLLAEICEEVHIDSHGTTEGRTNNLDLENNLNKWNSPKATDYVKNIPSDDPSVQSMSSGPDWQEVNHLISEVANELDMDAQRAVAGLQRDRELTARLRTIQGQRGVGEEGGVPGRDDTNVTGYSDDEDDEEATKRLIRQLLEERLLDQRVASTTGQAESSSTTHAKCPADDHTESTRESPLVCKDLPWCCICNTDATLVCCGCDSDLYCQRCFKEVHIKFGMGDHKTKPYKTSPAPDNYDSDDDNDGNW